MTPLAQLIEATIKRRGWTTAQVEDRGISHSTLHGYMTRETLYKQPLRTKSMETLAKVLDLPLSEVQRAAVASAGYLYDDHGATFAELRAEVEELRRQLGQRNPDDTP